MFVNKKGQKISVSDIPTSWLCPGCWSLISDYCGAAKVVDKVQLDPEDDKILSEIVQHSRSTKNPILKALFRDLKVKIHTVLNQSGKENRVSLLLMHLASERVLTQYA